MLTTDVSGPISAARRGAIAVRLCALRVRTTTSAMPAFVGSSVAETRASKFPISPRTRTPCSWIARRCAPRAIKITSSPDLASMAPTKAPMAPAPTMANFIMSLKPWRSLNALNDWPAPDDYRFPICGRSTLPQTQRCLANEDPRRAKDREQLLDQLICLLRRLREKRISHLLVGGQYPQFERCRRELQLRDRRIPNRADAPHPAEDLRGRSLPG